MWPYYCEDILFTTNWWTELRVADPAPLCLQRPRLWQSYVTDKISLYRYSNVLNCQCAISLRIISFCFINTLDFFTEGDEGTWGTGVRAPNTPQTDQNKTKPDEVEQNVKPLKVTWRRGMSHIGSKSGNVWRGGMTVCRGDAGGPVCSSHRAPGVPVPPTNNLRQPQSDHSCLCGTNPAAKEMAKQQKEQKTHLHTQTLLAFLAVFVWVHAHPPVTIRASVLHLSTTPLKLGGQKVETTQEWMSHLLHHLPISQSNPQVWTHANTALSHK